MSQAVWLFRTRKIRRRAKEAGLEWDEYPEAQAWQEDRWRLPWSWKGSEVGEIKETGRVEAGDATKDGRISIEGSGKVSDQNEDIEQCKHI